MAQQLNLYDASLRPQREWLTPLRLLGAAALVLIAQTGVARWLDHDAARWQAQAQADEAQLRQLADALGQVGGSDEGLPRLRAQLAQARQLAQALHGEGDAPADQAARVLAALSAAAGPEVWVSAAQWQAQPRQLALEGGLLKASQLPAYLRRLERQPVFAGQGFAQLQLQPAPSDQAPHHRFVLRSQPKEGGR